MSIETTREAAVTLREMLHSIEKAWQCDPCAKAAYVRLPIRLRREWRDVLRIVPPDIHYLRDPEQTDAVILADYQVSDLLAVVNRILQSHISLGDGAVCRLEDLDDLHQATRPLRQ